MAKDIQSILKELSFVDPELSSFVASTEFSLPLELEPDALRLITELRQQGGSIYYSEDRRDGVIHWRNTSLSGPTRVLLPILGELCSSRFFSGS